jgi:hypothetical protein
MKITLLVLASTGTNFTEYTAYATTNEETESRLYAPSPIIGGFKNGNTPYSFTGDDDRSSTELKTVSITGVPLEY